MTDIQFATQFLSVWSQYVTWISNNQNLQYGEPPHKNSYGGGVAPSVEGFIKWIEFIYLPANPNT